MKNKKIILALDTKDLNFAANIVKKVKDEINSIKIGYEFFFNHGLSGYKKIYNICPNIFLDLKLHDIPNTVNAGLKAIANLKPKFTTIHISGGDDMLKSAVSFRKKNTKILGVSILTSLNSEQTKKYYNEHNTKNLVIKFVKQAKKNNLDGIICSPKEISFIRKQMDKNFIIVTPGVRLKGSIIKNDDQKRILSPKEAMKLGANLLVIGRPILKSKDPLNVIKKINASIK